MKESVAIIGTGIAGMGCGYFLQSRYDLTVYEQNDYIGGHTNTVTVNEESREIPIDTGFMVYNETTYPYLTRLFRELDVPTKPTSMSFSVQHRPSGLEFCGAGLNGLFAQRRNLIRPAFLNLLRQIHRFNTQSTEIIHNAAYQSHSLRDYIVEKAYGSEFLNKYLVPMTSAVWSTPPGLMLDFPAVTLVRFLSNHGMLGLSCQLPWKTIVQGSRTYREKLIEPFRHRIFTRRAATRVTRQNRKATVRDSSGAEQTFDRVIFACHADQALKILADPTEEESTFLALFQYQKNIATLHTDPAVMPRLRRVWSSWNYRIDENGHGPVPSTIYYMNSLQDVSDRKDYFISINDPGIVDDRAVLKSIEYEHPLFNLRAIEAQKKLPTLNTNGATYFCGSYFRYGFHEDALQSAIDVCRAITGERIWQ